MSPAALWVTQLATFAAGAAFGGLVVYWTMTVRARRRQGGTMTEQTEARSKVWVWVLVLAALLIVGGLQFRAKNAQDDKYDRLQACLLQSLADQNQYLTNTLNKRVAANGRLDAAQEKLTNAGAALSRANTRIVLVVAGLNDHPPTATVPQFGAALERFRDLAAKLDAASKDYSKVKRQTQGDLGSTGTPTKPYDPPKVACHP